MTACQLSRAIQKMLCWNDETVFHDYADPVDQDARQNHPDAYNLVKYHWLGWAQPRPQSHATLSCLYQRLTAKGLAKYL